MEPSARRFTREEKGKSKGALLIIMIYIKPLIHILPAAFVDVEMADIHLNATGIPDADADTNPDADPCADVTMITAVDHSMDEEAQWEEDPVPKPSSSSQISDIWEALTSLSSRIGDVNDIWETLTSLSSRISDIEAYLGLQRGEQPIALYNGFAAGVINVRGSQSWTRDMRMAKWTEAKEDLADERDLIQARDVDDGQGLRRADVTHVLDSVDAVDEEEGQARGEDVDGDSARRRLRHGAHSFAFEGGGRRETRHGVPLNRYGAPG